MKFVAQRGLYVGQISDKTTEYVTESKERAQPCYVMWFLRASIQVSRVTGNFHMEGSYYMPLIIEIVCEEMKLLELQRDNSGLEQR